MKSPALLSVASSVAFLTGSVTAIPAFDAAARTFEYDALNAENVVRLAARQSGNTTLPDSTGLSYVVPAPVANGGKAWSEAHTRASALTNQMTLQEKVDLVTGQIGRCAGNTGAVPRLGVPSICHQDGPAGVRPAYGKTQFPAGVTGAATWDRDLIYQRSKAMGQEFYDLGINVALAPVTGGPLGRAPREGRNWEGWAPDPYYTGEAAYLSVKGLQDSGVTACAKHFIAYEQETFRNIFNQTASYSVFPASEQLPISSNVDDKTTHELYLWPFAEAVRAGVGYVMCSYNVINGTHSCANSETNNQLLKTELNFQGPVISDWGATWGTQAFVEGGEDLDMPGKGYGGALGVFFDTELYDLVSNGTIKEARLDDMVTRVLTPFIAHGQLDNPLPSTTINAVSLPEYEVIYRNVQEQSTIDLITKIGEDGAILLKNNGGLPLQNPQQIAVIGFDAGPNILGEQACGAFGDGCPIDNINGTFSLAYGSGYSQPQNLITPLAAIKYRALQTRALVQSVLNNSAIEDIQSTVATADVALVFVEAFADEGQDRENLNLTANGNAIIEAAAAYCNNTIVIMHIPGPTIIDAWVNHPNITAILAPLLPGEQAGNALVPLLYGDISPSGKLPFTIGKQASDYPPHTIVDTPVVAPQSNFTEKLEIDYRWFDSHNITPRYAFGFGLSYSEFSYSNIDLQSTYKADDKAIQATKEKFKGQSGSKSLYDTILTITVDVKNTGDVTACEVAQLYIEFSASENEPPRQLRGFDKLKQIGAGSTQTASFPIRRKDIMVWDVTLQEWRTPTDDYVVFHAGSSSRTLPLSVRYEI